MTTEQLAALKEVAEQAIPKDWQLVNGFVVECVTEPDKYGVTIAQVSGYNGAHIAAFDPTTCLGLLEEVERLQKENEILRNADYWFLQKVNEP